MRHAPCPCAPIPTFAPQTLCPMRPIPHVSHSLLPLCLTAPTSTLSAARMAAAKAPCCRRCRSAWAPPRARRGAARTSGRSSGRAVMRQRSRSPSGTQVKHCTLPLIPCTPHGCGCMHVMRAAGNCFRWFPGAPCFASFNLRTPGLAWFCVHRVCADFTVHVLRCLRLLSSPQITPKNGRGGCL